MISYFTQKGFDLLGQRVKTPYAEVDLLFQKLDGSVLMVEVKTSNIPDFQPHRISWKQKLRLQRALQFLTEHFECLVEVHWAFVTKDGDITVVEDVS